MTIVVCPLSRVTEMVALHQPQRVISLLNPDVPFPELGVLYTDRHLRLAFHDIHEAFGELRMPAPEHVHAVLAFLEDWDRTSPLLIHCHAGISRSTAVAFIAACYANPEIAEHEIAVQLRRTAPLARPNEVLVRLADDALARNGRMVDATAATGRELGWIDVAEGEPFTILLNKS